MVKRNLCYESERRDQANYMRVVLMLIVAPLFAFKLRRDVRSLISCIIGTVRFSALLRTLAGI